MRSLLDVNFLIALLDRDHVSHRMAVSWFGAHGGDGWSSCPITQNGCLRVMSSTGYRSPLPVVEIAARLSGLCANAVHQFWPDQISVLDRQGVDCSRIHGPRQLTDVYLLALAVRNDGRLVTFDTSIARNAVVGARDHHLLTL